MMQKKILKVLQSNEFFLFLIYMAICIGYPKPLFEDPDVAWHAGAGKLIRQLGFIPMHDPWTFSSDQIWYNLSWFWDLVTSYLYDFLKLEYIKLFSDALHALIVVYAYHALLAKEKISGDAKNVSITLLAMLVWEYSSFRPNIISIFFTIFLLSQLRSIYHANKTKQLSYCDSIAVSNFGTGRNGSRGQADGMTVLPINHELRFMYIFPILMAVWANCHGAFLVGFVVVGAYGISSLYQKEYQQFFSLVKAGILGMLAVMINPYGYHIWHGVLRTIDSNMLGHIKEWQPFIFGSNYSTSFVVIIVLLICQVFIKSSKLPERILFYAWLLMALTSIRNFIYFLVLGLPHLAKCMDINLPKAKITSKLKLEWRLVIIAVLLIGGVLIRPEMYKRNAHLFDVLPIQEAEFIRENFAGKNVLNTYNSGGILIFYGEGKFKHFIDGRAGTVFSEKILNENLDMFLQTPRWKRVFALYDIDVVLLNKTILRDKRYADYFANWKIEYIGRDNIILSANIH